MTFHKSRLKFVLEEIQRNNSIWIDPLSTEKNSYNTWEGLFRAELKRQLMHLSKCIGYRTQTLTFGCPISVSVIGSILIRDSGMLNCTEHKIYAT